jgi:hypothetical protein
VQPVIILNQYKTSRTAEKDRLKGADECTRWFKYDRDDLCVNKSRFVPVIFEPPCISTKREEVTDEWRNLPKEVLLGL